MQKNNFKLHVRSKGRSVDYSWIGNPPQISTNELTRLQGSLLYILSIEKRGALYHEFIAVYMPGTSDKYGGTIRLEMALEALTEPQARALALAYLKLPIRGENRVWEAAQKTYAQTADGFCTVDIPALQKEIERLIEENELLLSSESPGHQLRLWENIQTKGSQTQKAIEHLQRYRLSEADGIKVYLNDAITEEEADLSLQAEDPEDKEEQLPLPKMDSEDKEEQLPLPEENPAPRPQPQSPEQPTGIEQAPQKAEKPKQTDIIAPGGKEIEQLKKYIARCAILAVIVGTLLLITYNASKKTVLSVQCTTTCQLKIQDQSYNIRAPRDITLPHSPTGILKLEITKVPEGSSVILNGVEIGKAPGKYTISAQGGTLRILPPHQ